MAPGLIDQEQLLFMSSVEDGAGPPWPVMAGDMAWDGRHLEPSKFIHQLTAKEIEEIESAVTLFKSLGLDGPDINPDNFPLPTFGRKLEEAAQSIHSGTGVFVLRGLEPRKYSVEDNAIIFLGLSSYVGAERGMQDNKGNMIVHLCDKRKTASKASNKATPFHTDLYCDIIAFYVRQTASRGGTTKLASMWQVYNELRADRPELLETLSKPGWGFESRGKMFPECVRPVMFHHDGKIIVSYSRRPLMGKKAHSLCDPSSRLNLDQAEALQTLQERAENFQMLLPQQNGDMIFINNHACLHSRDAFEDEGEESRHLMRLWLKNRSLSWKLPQPLAKGNRRVFGENELNETWNLYPNTLETGVTAEPYESTSH